MPYHPLDTDTSLIKMVHEERHGPYIIKAMITRFGEMEVFVWQHYPHKLPGPGKRNKKEIAAEVVWQGENILAARVWVRSQAHEDA